MRTLLKIRPPNFISFSGIDGSGKSTQIDALRERLQGCGLRVVTIRFWDDIARMTRLRETIGHEVFKGDKGVGTPSAPINRRDKNVRSHLMTSLRLLLYLVDTISQRIAVAKVLRSNADLVIFDRYIYDELANLTLANSLIRAYVRLIMKFVPRPDISYLLDADPAMVRARKPEYPLEFLYVNRQSYLDLNQLIGIMTVIAPMPVEETKRTVFGHISERLSLGPAEPPTTSVAPLREKSDEVAGRERAQSSPAIS